MYEFTSGSAKVSQQGEARTLTVDASMQVPTAGHTAKLSRSIEQGLPETLYLDFVLTPPMGMVNQVISIVSAQPSFSIPEYNGGFTKVLIKEGTHNNSIELNVEDI